MSVLLLLVEEGTFRNALFNSSEVAPSKTKIFGFSKIFTCHSFGVCNKTQKKKPNDTLQMIIFRLANVLRYLQIH